MTEKLHEQFYLNYLQVGITLPVLLLGIIGYFSSEPLIGLVVVSLWFVLVTLRKGTEIHYQLKQVNFFIRFLGIKLNSWERIEAYKAYIIRRKVNSVQYTSRVQQQTLHFEQTILALFKDDPKNFRIVKADKKENLIQLGLQFEKKLGIKRHITKR